MDKKNNSIIITDMKWERTLLYIYTNDEKNNRILNLTIANNVSFFENGNYDIFAKNITGDLARKVNNGELDRVFRYDKNLAYTVTFEIREKDGKFYIFLNSQFMKENKDWKKNQEKFTSRFIKGGIAFLYKAIALFTFHSGKKILFMQESANLFTGNIKALIDRAKDRGLEKDFTIIYSKRASIGSKNIFAWIRTLIKIASADYIFLDNYAAIFSYIKLSKKTKLIQLWHAGAGFKAVGYIRFGKDGSPHPYLSGHRKYTTIIAPSKERAKVLSELFGISEKNFFIVGLPRLDGYLNEDRIIKFKNFFYTKYPDFIGKTIILFAPTYRGQGQKEAFYDFSKIELEKIYDFLGKEKVLLIKNHPFVKEKLDLSLYSDRIFNLSDYENINELFYITDILITDYSSAYYEFSLMEKPIIFYTYDRVIYEQVRGVHQDIKESAPGKVVDNFDALMQALIKKDYEIEKTIKFKKEQFLEPLNGACDKILDEVLGKK